MRSCAHPWSCSTWRPSAQELERDTSPSSSSQLPTQKKKKTKAKDVKRKGVVVLAAELDTKRGRDQSESSKGS